MTKRVFGFTESFSGAALFLWTFGRAARLVITYMISVPVGSARVTSVREGGPPGSAQGNFKPYRALTNTAFLTSSLRWSRLGLAVTYIHTGIHLTNTVKSNGSEPRLAPAWSTGRAAYN